MKAPQPFHTIRHYGGAICLLYSEASLNGAITKFRSNHANSGGAIFMVGTTLLLSGEMANLVNNTATNAGGGILIANSSRLTITTEQM